MSSYDDDPSIGTVLAWFGVVVLVIGLITLGGWGAGWWFRTQDSQLQWQVDKNSGAYQQGHTDQLSNAILDLDKINGQITAADPEQAAQLKAQRSAEGQMACRLARDITQPAPDEATWRDQNCFAGALAPASKYNN